MPARPGRQRLNIRFLFVTSRLRYPLLSAWTSQSRPLGPRLAVHSESLQPGPPEDFHLQVITHAGHTKERGAVIAAAALFYLYALLTMTNKAHGHGPTDFSPLSMAGVTIVIFAVLALLDRFIKRGKRPLEEIPYSPRSLDMPLFKSWLAWHVGAAVLPLLLLPALKPALVLLALSGVALGVSSCVSSLYQVLKPLSV